MRTVDRGQPAHGEPAIARILVTNDDGIYAPGLWALVDAVSYLGEVVVIAPDREQSGIGAAISLHHPLRLSKLRMPAHPEIDTYAVQGTPGDCVILGLQNIMKDGVDLVVSGVNDGANLGNDVLISGTVGGAMQGYFAGIPAIAVSAAWKTTDFRPAARVAAVLADFILSERLPSEVLLNVNVPDRPLDRMSGIAVTTLARQTYVDVIEQTEDARGRMIYWITRGRATTDEFEPGTDIWAMRNHYISITPLQSDLASREQFELLEELIPALRQHLLAPLPVLED
ncbi:MAG: 5'/3'-nucleotidase SurE [Chloroflexota bacterium]|nr:5'/3'-nucleotidase SurE [Dehalococcoidia bacterium]MDW8253278.1 5'/3'-nucleotidase SurE [Chloroflexota bacterium]